MIERINAVRKVLQEKNIDAAIVTKRENYLYLSGFTGSLAYLIITQMRAVLFIDFRYVEQARQQVLHCEVIEYSDNVYETINKALKEDAGLISCLGFEDKYVTYNDYIEYQDKLNLNKSGIFKFVPLNKAIDELRMVKDSSEIGIIKTAVQIADDAFSHTLSFIKPGVSELEIAAELEYYMKKQGASGTSFETIVASGIRSVLPHGVASGKKLEQGDVIIMDFGAMYKNYCSDMTRTVFLGIPKHEAEMVKIYNIVKDTQKRGLDYICSGILGKDVDFYVRELIASFGYGNNFGHGLGHGVGLEIHEAPRLSKLGNTVLANGMIVTVEPGIYVSNVGGVRIEDMVLIKDNKAEVLTRSTKDMIIL